MMHLVRVQLRADDGRDAVAELLDRFLGVLPISSQKSPTWPVPRWAALSDNISGVK